MVSGFDELLKCRVTVQRLHVKVPVTKERLLHHSKVIQEPQGRAVRGRHWPGLGGAMAQAHPRQPHLHLQPCPGRQPRALVHTREDHPPLCHTAEVCVANNVAGRAPCPAAPRWWCATARLRFADVRVASSILQRLTTNRETVLAYLAAAVEKCPPLPCRRLLLQRSAARPRPRPRPYLRGTRAKGQRSRSNSLPAEHTLTAYSAANMPSAHPHTHSRGRNR